MNVGVRHFTATQCGWVRRPECGRNVWEMPDGQLYAHFDDTEPVIAKYPGFIQLRDTNGEAPDAPA